MMDIFNDFDLCQEALKKVNLSEAAMPVVRGILVEDVDTYNKIQTLLNTPALESCHRFLYNLDVEQLSEDEVNKVNNLYKLGQDRGFIDLDEPNEPENTADVVDQPAPVQAAPTATQPQAIQAPNDSAFTVAYSAMKDGMMKTGEAYSNAVSTRAAKADVISKLEKAGYSAIEILCIEAGDPDMKNCSNTYYAQPTLDNSAIYEKDDKDASADSDDASDSNADDSSDSSSDSNDSGDSAGDKDSDDKKDDSKEDSDDKEDDSKEDSDDKEDDSKEEDAEEPDEKLNDKSDDKAAAATDDKDEKDLSAEEKSALKDSYKKAFKATLQKCKFEMSFSELSLEEKVEFLTKLSEAWGDKADPTKFMSDNEMKQLEKIVVKKN